MRPLRLAGAPPSLLPPPSGPGGQGLAAVDVACIRLALASADEREIAAADFFDGIMSTALEPDEILLEARIPLPPDDTRFGFYEMSRRAGDFAMAAGIYGQVLEHDPENFKVAAKLAQAYIKLGEVEAAKAILAEIPVAKSQDPDVLSAHAALELADKAAEAHNQLADLEAKLAADPKDHQARLDLAEAQAAVGQSEEAVDNLLHIIQVNKDWNDGAARLQLLKVFEALGPMDPVVQSGRRRLSSLLFS